LTKALETFCKWSGEEGECSFEINRDFIPVNVDAQTLTAWLALVQSGEMSSPSLFALLKRADLVDAEKTYEEEQGDVDNTKLPEPPSLKNPKEPEKPEE
jgi:hypothetical protein